MKNLNGVRFHAAHAIFTFRTFIENDTAIALNNKWEHVHFTFSKTTKKWIIEGVLIGKQYWIFKQELDIAMLEYQQATIDMRMVLMTLPGNHWSTTHIKKMNHLHVRSKYAFDIAGHTNEEDDDLPF